MQSISVLGVVPVSLRADAQCSSRQSVLDLMHFSCWVATASQLYFAVTASVLLLTQAESAVTKFEGRLAGRFAFEHVERH